MSASAMPHDGDATTPWNSDRIVLPWIGWEFPARSPGNEGQAFSVARAGVGPPAETKKARSVVALRRVPRWERGAPVRLRLPVTVAKSCEPFNGIPGERCWPPRVLMDVSDPRF